MPKLIRLFKSFSYAFHGLFKTFREEQNLQVQSLVGIIIIALGFVFQIKSLEWCFIIFAIVLVLIMELINSAVERIADTLKPRIHQYVMEMKDIMAAAVMLASILAVVIGLIIFLPYIATAFF